MLSHVDVRSPRAFDAALHLIEPPLYGTPNRGPFYQFSFLDHGLHDTAVRGPKWKVSLMDQP